MQANEIVKFYDIIKGVTNKLISHSYIIKFRKLKD